MSNKHLKVGGQGGTADPKEQSQDKIFKEGIKNQQFIVQSANLTNK